MARLWNVQAKQNIDNEGENDSACNQRRPRKGWNTDMLLKKALEDAASAGAETEMVYLYDLKFKGCISCLGCKLQ